MNEIAKRIKELRKINNISQDELAQMIDMKRNSIAQIETGIRNASDRTLNSICYALKVNKDWLYHGTEPMFKELSKEEEIVAYMGTLLSDDGNQFQKRFIRALSKLDDDGWDVIEKLINNMVENK